MPKDVNCKEGDYFSDKFLFVDANDTEAIDAFRYDTGSEWGTYHTGLTQEDIKQLMAGKWLLIGQGEYTTIISFENEAADHDPA